MADQYRRDPLERRRSALKLERESFISHYKELAEFIAPRKGRFFLTDRNKGEKKWQSIINSRATFAHRVARSGLLAGIMSPARPWFSLETNDPGMMEYAPVKEWLYVVEKILRAVFNGSNLYNMAPTMIGELLLFGTGCMTHVDDFDDVARFYTLTAGSYMIGQNHKYQVDTLVREWEMTVEQLVGQFGIGKVSQSVKNAYDKGDYDKWFPVVQHISPNPEFDENKKLAKFKRFRSRYYEPGQADKDALLSESGYDTFPAYIPRWDVTGEDVYGTDCPAMQALGDIRGLQIEEKRKAQGIDKNVNPPLHGPASLRNTPVSSLPGGLTIYDAGQQPLAPIYQVQVPLQDLMLDIEKVERRIDNAFYVDLFLAITNMEGIQPRNQLDLAKRDGERLLQIGPVLERFHGEFLSKLIDRTFDQCNAAGILPPAPEELQGKPLKVEYISTLAMAQRAVATGGIEKLAGFVGALMASGMQQAGDKFDADQAIDEYAAVIGVPPRIVVPDEKVAQIRAERQQMAQQQRAMEMAQAGANTTKMLSDAKTSEPSALTSVSEAVAGAQRG